jgi:hypothetical protein
LARQQKPHPQQQQQQQSNLMPVSAISTERDSLYYAGAKKSTGGAADSHLRFAAQHLHIVSNLPSAPHDAKVTLI